MDLLLTTVSGFYGKLQHLTQPYYVLEYHLKEPLRLCMLHMLMYTKLA